MSGVLDRMVQRSRGNLPAIEPLVRAQQTAAAALPFLMEESAAAGSRGRNAASTGRERALREASAGPVPDDVRRDAAQPRQATRKDSRQSEALGVDGVKGAAETDGTPAANEGERDGLNRALLERDIAQEGEEPRESSIEMRAEKMPAQSEETARESTRTKATVEQRDATPNMSAARNEMDGAASAIDEAEHTEIHITIGSVELRAPRVAPVPPKAPPFRPRVTLDEFLKRGAGSGGWGAKS